MEELTAYFLACGFSQTRATDTAKGKSSALVKSFFAANELETRQLSDKQALLCMNIVTVKEGTSLNDAQRRYVLAAVLDGRLTAGDQVTAALQFLTKHALPVEEAAFNKACGVGFSATPEEVQLLVKSYVESNKEALSKLAWDGLSKTVSTMRTTDELRWVNALELRTAAEGVYLEEFGPKKEKVAAAKVKKVAAPASSTSAGPVVPIAEEMFTKGWLSRLYKPGENEQPNPQRMVEHLAATKGKVYTRFPPEPNGFLHIGHSKAITVNFGFAKHHQGHCYLRFDDTNPEAEEQIYFDKIVEAVRWLGFEPYKITYSSDNFQKLYDLAVDLIKRGLAYTCTDSQAEMKIQRGGDSHGLRTDSKDRTKPIEQCLKEFADMRAGKYKPGEITLRMKMDMQDPNPCMWDTPAYRVLSKPHHRTGTEWCIYPTYDFTHCLCDSFENISHSLCTTEFITARQSYEWLCDALDVYKPRQSEYGRLNLEGTVMSKRKLKKLVDDGHVAGWDDPRLYTIVALKRRGVPPGAIIQFVSNLGVSTSPSHVPLARFEQEVRQYLETTTPRLMMVLHPVRLTIENLPTDYHILIEKPIHPKNPAMGVNNVPFTPTIYIDRDDFRFEYSKEFFRLSPGATVGLLNVPHSITYVSHEVDAHGEVTSIVCRYEDGPAPPKPKAWIQWVAEDAASHSPVRVDETRVFKRLFKSDDPAALSDGYIEDLNPDSLTIVKGAMVEVGIWKVVKDSLEEAKKVVEERRKDALEKGTDAPPQVDGLEVVRFQGLRVAYFALDQDTVLEEGGGAGKLVLNLVAPLKEDSGKKA